MKGIQEITVDEETRRKIYSIEESQKDPVTQQAPVSIIKDNKIKVNFNELSIDTIQFKVRTGSLIESRHEKQQKQLQELIVPISQMLGALPDEDKSAFTNVLMKMLQRLLEEADIDISADSGKQIESRLVIDALKQTMLQVAEQNKIQEQMAQQLQGIMAGQPQQTQNNQQSIVQQQSEAKQPPENNIRCHPIQNI